jgi:hypothetical protein
MTGNRSYLFYEKNITTESVDLNYTVMKELGVKFLISPYRVKEKDEEGLIYLKTFDNNDSFWQINLYQLK